MVDFRNLSKKVISDFIDEWEWFVISQDQLLSENLIKEYENKVDWNIIFCFQNISKDFFDEFEEQIDILLRHFLYSCSDYLNLEKIYDEHPEWKKILKT